MRFVVVSWMWLALVCLAGAEPIPGLFNTGVDAAGKTLAGGAVDPHWKLVMSPDPVSPGPNALVVNEGFPVTAWLANSANSKWIAPLADQSSGSSAGNYTYRLGFDLYGFDAATASLTLRGAFDNQGMAVLLNGTNTGIVFPSSGADNYLHFSPNFILSKGFLPGANTLDVVMSNWSAVVNPTGFRVEISGTAAPTNSAPVITGQPQDVSVLFKDSIALSGVVSGSVPLQVQWFHGGSAVPKATNASLTIPWAGATDAGQYWLWASNAFGTATSRVAVVSLRTASPAERIYEPPGPSSRATGVAITEIMYHPKARADGKDLEFIELYNSNPFYEDLSGWQISGDITFTFPTNTILGGKEYLVLAANPADMKAAYGLATIAGPYAKHLSNGSGSFRVSKRSGGVVLAVSYSDHAPWPAAADGVGTSLVLARPSYGEADARAWAASAKMGGSPGSADPLPDAPTGSLVINEILANPLPGRRQFVELRNNGILPVDLSGYRLQDAAGLRSYTVSGGTILAPGSLALFSEDDLGFRWSPAGDGVFLVDPSLTQVVDGVRFDGQLGGMSWGRIPVAASTFQMLGTSTPGVENSAEFRGDVIFNEINFNPLLGGADAEFVELFNRGATEVDLGGWALAGEVNYTFRGGTRLAPGAYAVVARNTNWLAANNPVPFSSPLLGNYTGKLSNSGGRLVLTRPETAITSDSISGLLVTNVFPVVVNELPYLDGGQWGNWAGGGGSTLELLNPAADGRFGANWADSDESSKAPWTTLEYTGVLDLPHPSLPSADQLQIILMGAGEALVDNVEVLVNGANRVADGTFESGLNGWLFQGTERLSRWESTEGFESSHSLHLVAVDRGENEANRVATDLSASIPTNQTATIRAHVRWLAGSPEIVLRLRNGALEASGSLSVPTATGSPGRRNGRSISNTPPIISETTHWPVLPAAGQAVRVTARIQDPDGVGLVQLRYRVDPSTSLQSSPMVDDGSGPDEIAGDGVFTGVLPGQAAGTLLAFHILAADAGSPCATALYPTGAPDHECLVRFGETAAPGAFGTYRIWLTAAAQQYWTIRERLSNENIDATFVYGTNRVVYQAGSRYSGSPYSAVTYTGPIGALCGYSVDLPPEDRILGATSMVLDWPIRDDTDQREPLLFWFLEQYGLPNLYRRYIHLYVNGQVRGTIYDDVQQPGQEVLDEWFASDNQGHLWKTDCWNESDDQGNQYEPCVLNTLENLTSGGIKKISRYRWCWRPRASGSANDYSSLFSLVDLVNTNNQYAANLQAGIDIDQWMRTFAMNDLGAFWDAFGNWYSKNTFLYKPENDRWKVICWDMDVGLGSSPPLDPTDSPLFRANDPTFAMIYATPALVRPYWAALDEALKGFFQIPRISPLLDAKYAAFQADGLGLNNPSAIKSWITDRRTFLLKQLAAVNTSFAIVTHGGNDFTTTNATVNLQGRAPVSLATLKINGIAAPITWTTLTNWSINVSLAPGTNTLQIAGFDRAGNAVPSAAATLHIIYQGGIDSVAAIRINEWMASNQSTVRDPASNAYDDWFELYNAGTTPVDLNGYSLSNSHANPGLSVIPAGFSLLPQHFLKVWANKHPEQSIPGGDLHVNFKLSKELGEIALFDSTGRLVDNVTFTNQQPDISEGRWGDGEPGPAFVLTTPSPGGANSEPILGSVAFNLHASVDSGTGPVLLNWSATPGRKYQVQYRDHLVPDSWQNLGDPVVAVAAGVSVSDDRPLESGGRFYRVVMLP